MTRVYLMPLAPNANGEIQPKYRADYTVEGVGAGILPYGLQDVCLLCLTNVDQATHDLIAAHADVTALPQNLDQDIGAQLATVQGKLDALEIPSGWVQSTFSYRTVLRAVAILFLLLQRYNGPDVNAAKLLNGTITLDTTWNQLPAGVRTNLQALATLYAFDTSAVTNSTTVRQVFKLLWDQWPAIEIPVQGVVL